MSKGYLARGTIEAGSSAGYGGWCLSDVSLPVREGRVQVQATLALHNQHPEKLSPVTYMFLGVSDCATVLAVNENDLRGRPVGACGILTLTPSRLPRDRHRPGDSHRGSESWGQASAYLFGSISRDGSHSGREQPLKG